MRRTRSAILLLVLGIIGLHPAPASADHCGSAATVTPSSGPPGTTFVFRTNLGEASILSLYRDGTRIRSVTLKGSGFVRYGIRTGAGDAGSWRARAEVRGHAECAAEATFTVTGAPDTATGPGGEPTSSQGGPSWILLGLAAWLGSALGIRRSGSARRPCRPSARLATRPHDTGAAPSFGSTGVRASSRDHRQRVTWR